MLLAFRRKIRDKDYRGGMRNLLASQRGDAQQAKSYPQVILYGFPGIFRVRQGATTEAQGILHGLKGKLTLLLRSAYS